MSETPTTTPTESEFLARVDEAVAKANAALHNDRTIRQRIETLEKRVAQLEARLEDAIALRQTRLPETTTTTTDVRDRKAPAKRVRR